MSHYEIEVSRSAERQLKKLVRDDRQRVARAINGLTSEPRPRGARKLQGYEDAYRIRVGVLRIVYSVEALRVTIIILKIGHRKNVYR